MSLKVIGAGFGRTGTKSLKLALEIIGFGPCHHMVEVLRNEGKPEQWAAAANGEKMDWDAVFAGYQSTVDWPSTDYWRELAAYAPDAKIILTLRDPEAWFRSTQQTIFGEINSPMATAETPDGTILRAIFSKNFNNQPYDRDTCLAAYAAHNAGVIRDVPPARLLVFNVAEGWGPLCKFLGVPVPDLPFPQVNSTDEFRENMVARRAAAGTPPA
jgi:hypothetical protein